VKLALLDRLLSTSRAGTPIALATHLASGAQSLVTSERIEGDLALDDGAVAEVRRALDDDRSGVIEAPNGPVFVEVFNRPLRLIVVGAVHTAQELVPLARLAGYEVTVVDPRTAFATPERFPGTTLRNDWPAEAFAALKPDRRTAVVTLSHDPKIDDPALAAALSSEAFYVGALGSRRTQSKRLERLHAAGLDPAALTRIRAPVGLAIGALTPAEIAISIMAEITAVLRRAPLALSPNAAATR
jgi:xanthine dehydrogenase accessory factor